MCGPSRHGHRHRPATPMNFVEGLRESLILKTESIYPMKTFIVLIRRSSPSDKSERARERPLVQIARCIALDFPDTELGLLLKRVAELVTKHWWACEGCKCHS